MIYILYVKPKTPEEIRNVAGPVPQLGFAGTSANNNLEAP